MRVNVVVEKALLNDLVNTPFRGSGNTLPCTYRLAMANVQENFRRNVLRGPAQGVRSRVHDFCESEVGHFYEPILVEQ